MAVQWCVPSPAGRLGQVVSCSVAGRLWEILFKASPGVLRRIQRLLPLSEKLETLLYNHVTQILTAT